MNTTRISIIIPVYNKVLYIPSCLESIISQIDSKNNRYEVLIIDDGSNDGSSAIIESYSQLYDYISVYSQTNSGVSVARNRGIDMAVGDYVIFIDADDELIDGSLRKVYDYLNHHPSIDMLITRQIRRRNEKDVLVKKPTLEEDKTYNGVEAYQKKYIRTNAGGGICRTQFLRDNKLYFPVGVKNSEDTIFFGLVQVYSRSIVFLDISFYRINEVEGSASRVNEYNFALRCVEPIKSAQKIRNELQCTERQKAIFEYVIYQLLSNGAYHFANAEGLSFMDFVSRVSPKSILPIKTKYMCISVQKAKLLNISYAFLYFTFWIRRVVQGNKCML